MAKFTLYGILLTLGLFFVLSGLLLAQIEVENPYINTHSSVLRLILDWIVP